MKHYPILISYAELEHCAASGHLLFKAARVSGGISTPEPKGGGGKEEKALMQLAAVITTKGE